MGGGNWRSDTFKKYSHSAGRSVKLDGTLDSSLTDSQIYTQRYIHKDLDPKNVIRECCDSEEHPATIPVILALDVTGSMGPAAAEVAKKLNVIMTKLYNEVKDVEFMVMGIGDLAYDNAPIQIGQFESDIRIAEQLDRIYMEHGGGGNSFESYTAAWYMGLHHTKLDCWKRGRKGLIITLGDEPLNPYLPYEELGKVTGDDLQADIETKNLFNAVQEKYELYHIHVHHRDPDYYEDAVNASFGEQLQQGHFMIKTLDELTDAVVDIVKNHAKENEETVVQSAGYITW